MPFRLILRVYLFHDHSARRTRCEGVDEGMRRFEAWDVGDDDLRDAERQRSEAGRVAARGEHPYVDEAEAGPATPQGIYARRP